MFKNISVEKWSRKPDLEQKFTLLSLNLMPLYPFLGPTPPPWVCFFHFFSSTIYFSFLSVAPLIPLHAHLLTPTITCSSKTPLSSSLLSLILLSLSLSLTVFLQPTTAASQSCQPSLMWEPLNCHPLATRWSIRVSLASTWPEDQSTGPAGPMGAGQGNHLFVQV